MSSFCSTRKAGCETLGFLSLLLGTLAFNDGLFVPLAHLKVGTAELLQWRFLTYHELAFRVTRLFINDLPYFAVRKLLSVSYNKQSFRSSNRTALAFGPVSLKHLWINNALSSVAELSRGLSLSFKDVAMRAMGLFFGYSLQQHLRIISATSGDTGSSVCFALVGKSRCWVTVLSPYLGLTAVQEEQLYGIISRGVSNVRLWGKFDCCQNLLKKILVRCSNANGTMNSINWVRIMLQVVYYFAVYFRVTNSKSDLVVVSVPSGNFGNSFAGFTAKQLGLPVQAIVVSTNENNVLEEFFRSGKYSIRSNTNTTKTDCPSMDISKASNLERLVYEVLNQNSRLLADAMQQTIGRKTLNLLEYISFRTIRNLGVSAFSSYRQERSCLIRFLFLRLGVLVDAHTANGIKVLLAKHPGHHPTVIFETAQPLKTKELITEVTARSYRLGTFRLTKQSSVVGSISSHLIRVARC